MSILPNGNIQTTAIGVGCAYLTRGLTRRSEQAVIKTALDAGARHFDVAPQYGLGTAESILGQALKAERNNVTIATKVGIRRPKSAPAKLIARSLLAPVRKLVRQHAAARAGEKSPNAPFQETRTPTDFSLQHISSSFDQSLRNLRTDHVDGLLLHMVTAADLTDELLQWLAKQKADGKALAIGLATEAEDIIAIRNISNFHFEIFQHTWSIDVPSIDNYRTFTIAHRVIARHLWRLHRKITTNPAFARTLSDATGEDLFDPERLADVLIGGAVGMNSNGITLIASREPARISRNIQAGLNPKFQRAGTRLIAEIGKESDTTRHSG